MHQSHQFEFRHISQGLYKRADRLVRGARFSSLRYKELETVWEFFREGTPWFCAVEAACKVHGVAFGPKLKNPKHEEIQHEH